MVCSGPGSPCRPRSWRSGTSSPSISGLAPDHDVDGAADRRGVPVGRGATFPSAGSRQDLRSEVPKACRQCRHRGGADRSPITLAEPVRGFVVQIDEVGGLHHHYERVMVGRLIGRQESHPVPPAQSSSAQTRFSVPTTRFTPSAVRGQLPIQRLHRSPAPLLDRHRPAVGI
jgi:hypothetical protein